jgi:hypothetical protein
MAVQFVDEREKQIFDRAKRGEDVRAFLSTHPVGVLLHQRAKQLIADARVEALEVDPDTFRGWLFGRRKLRQIRQKAAIGTAFIDWMAEAILDGDAATKELEEYRE